MDGSQVIKVISANEMELKINGNIIFAYYNYKNVKVRVVYTVFGTKKVAYYEIIKEGLRDKKGKILYTKSAKLKAQAEAEAARIKALESAIYYDKNTGLEWLPGPDRNITWKKAKRWVKSLTAIAGGGWRMPTRKELKTLYKKGAGTRNMTPLLKTTGWRVWSGETKGSSSAWVFIFYDGLEYWLNRGFSYYGARVFAVRSRK